MTCVTGTERAPDDMLTDVEYANAFQESEVSQASEPHFSRPQWNVDSCPGSIFSATTDPLPTMIPPSSAISNVVTQLTDVELSTFNGCIGDMAPLGYPDNSMAALERVCGEYVFQQQQPAQPLEPQQVEVHLETFHQVPQQEARVLHPQQPASQVLQQEARVLHPQQPASQVLQQEARVLHPQQPASQVPETPQQTVDIRGFNVCKPKPVTSLQSQRTLFPTPPQSEAAVTYEESVPGPSRYNLYSDGATVSSIAMIIPVMKQLIICATCIKKFNRAFICNNYLIQLNRPVQCAWGCVLCRLCYSEQSGCRLHNISSTRAALSTTANTLANFPALENVGDWDLELNIDDKFKTDKEVNVHVQLIMNEEQSSGVDTL
ncbi:uncharacterized protein ACWYII_007194 [Salvelinus alpinus]